MKKLLIGLAFIGAAISANASILYWQVADGATGTDGDVGTYNAVKFYANDDKGAWNPTTLYFGPNSSGSVDTADFSAPSGTWETGDYWDNASYYIEYGNYINGNPATYEAAGYTGKFNLAQVSSLMTEVAAIKSQMANASTSGGAAPEPTSGLLTLLGMALLGLRRRRA